MNTIQRSKGLTPPVHQWTFDPYASQWDVPPQLFPENNATNTFRKVTEHNQASRKKI